MRKRLFWFSLSAGVLIAAMVSTWHSDFALVLSVPGYVVEQYARLSVLVGIGNTNVSLSIVNIAVYTAAIYPLVSFVHWMRASKRPVTLV